MSIQSLQSSVSSAQRDVGDLQKRIGDISKKESGLSQKAAQVQGSLASTSSSSGLQSKLRDVARLQGDIAKAQAEKAALQKRLADKTSQLHRYESDLVKEQEKERKKIVEADKRRQKEQLDYQKKLSRSLEEQKRQLTELQPLPVNQLNGGEIMKKYDIFISHASEDKEMFVRPLAEALQRLGVEVWFDELQLKVGDSLRRSIDRGLGNSTYGVVVLSGSFFAKNWPQYELDGLVAREMNGVKVILPIWHKVSKDEVMAYSPTLADKVALNSSIMSIEEIAAQLADVAKS